jgi:uncharacterized membrane protein
MISPGLATATGEERARVARDAGRRWERRIFVVTVVGVLVLVVATVVDLENVGVKGRGVGTEE